MKVKYAIVDAKDLIASQHDDLRANSDYPSVLQPRDRSRFASQQQIARIAGNLNPRLLMDNPLSSEGAPIIGKDGVVESGNGRVLAIRKAYAEGGAEKYRQALTDAGHKTEGVDHPVLVRVRETPMTDAERVNFTQESNQRSTASMSATEQAMTDAHKITAGSLDKFRGGEIKAVGNRDFLRAAIDDVIPKNEQASVFTKDGELSQEAERRINGALLAKAYGDESILRLLTESTDNELTSFGRALTSVAPSWAKMRELAGEGHISPEVDITANIVDAAKIILRSRREGKPLAHYLDTTDMFAGDVDPITKLLLGVMHSNEEMTKFRSYDKMAGFLSEYVKEAEKTQTGSNLFGEAPSPPSEIINAAYRKAIGHDAEETATLFQSGDRLHGQGIGEGSERSDGQGREVSSDELGNAGAADLSQPSNGAYTPATETTRGIIKLFKSADASTALHEGAHHFLNMMRRATARDGAPESLKAEMDLVHKWLRVKDGDWGALTERQRVRAEEKFARGFERYMMEGHAPSPALEGVFAKFKSWLTAIYQTVKNIPDQAGGITPEIRSFFDRVMTSGEGQKAVIAPEMEPGKMAADIHAADALHTGPDQAPAVADTMRKEIDLTAKQHNPEIADAIKSAETNAGASPAESDAGTGAAAGEPAAGSGPAQEPDAVASGGGGIEAEGPASTGGEPAGGQYTAEPKWVADERRNESVRENYYRAPDETPENFIANINMDKMIGGDGFDEAVRAAAEKSNNFAADRRTGMTAGQKMDLADFVGQNPRWLDEKKIGDAFNEEEVKAAKAITQRAYMDVRKLEAEALQAKASGVGREQAALKLAAAYARFEYCIGKVSQSAAEAGRALAAHRAIIGHDGLEVGMDNLSDFLQKNTGRDLFQMEQMAEMSKDFSLSQKAKFARDTSEAGFAGKLKKGILYYYINTLLSGPFTHLRYFVGNEVKAFLKPITETAIAASIDSTKAMFGKEFEPGQRHYFGEILAEYAGFYAGHLDGFKAALKAYKTGYSEPLGKQADATLFDMNTMVKKSGIVNKAVDIYGTPQRAVSAIHSLNKTVSYTQDIYGQSFRLAKSEGLEGSAFTGRVAELKSSPTDAMMESAAEKSMARNYMAPAKYGTSSWYLSKAIDNSLAAKIVIPFMRVGANITRETFVEGSPLGVFSQKVSDNLSGKNGNLAQSEQMARMTAGTGLMVMSAYLTSEGLMTGDGPSDKTSRALWLKTHTPNSVTIGGIAIPFAGLGSIGMAMRFAANMTEVLQHADEKDATHIAWSALEGLTKSVLDDNFMRGMDDLLTAVFHPEEYGMSYIRNFASTITPWSVGMGQVAREIDPVQRDAQTIADSIRAKTPGLRETLYPRVDIFGQPISRDENKEANKNDPVIQRLTALNKGIGQIPRRIRGIPLTEQQYFEFSTLAGRKTKAHLDNLIGQPSFAQQSPAYQIDRIHQIVNKSREDARRVMMQNYPEIARQAHEIKIHGTR